MVIGIGLLLFALLGTVLWSIPDLDGDTRSTCLFDVPDLTCPGRWNLTLAFCRAPLLVTWFVVLGSIDHRARGAARYPFIPSIAVAVSAGWIARGGRLIHGNPAGVLTALLRPRQHV